MLNKLSDVEIGTIAYFIVQEKELLKQMGVDEKIIEHAQGKPLHPAYLAGKIEEYKNKTRISVTGQSQWDRHQEALKRALLNAHGDPEQDRRSSNSSFNVNIQAKIDMGSLVSNCLNSGMSNPNAGSGYTDPAPDSLTGTTPDGPGGAQTGNHGQVTQGNVGCPGCVSAPLTDFSDTDGSCFGALDPYKVFTPTGGGTRYNPPPNNQPHNQYASYHWKVVQTHTEANGKNKVTTTKSFRPMHIEYNGNSVYSVTGYLKSSSVDSKGNELEGGYSSKKITVTPEQNTQNYKNSLEDGGKAKEPLDNLDGTPDGQVNPPSDGSGYDQEGNGGDCAGAAENTLATCLFPASSHGLGIGGDEKPGCSEYYQCMHNGGIGCGGSPLANQVSGNNGNSNCKPESFGVNMWLMNPGLPITDPAPNTSDGTKGPADNLGSTGGGKGNPPKGK